MAQEMIYKFVEGCRLKGDPQVIGEEIAKLSANNAAFGPATVVKAAQNPKSPLHKYFDWDDAVAGPKWRQQQAGYMIRHITVVRDEEEDSPRIRAFVAVEHNSDKGRFVPIGLALSVPAYREQLMIDAERELNSYREKYNTLKSVQEYWQPLTTAQKALAKRVQKVKAKLDLKNSKKVQKAKVKK